MKTKPTLLELLRKQPEMYLRDLPETIRIPALDGNRPDEVVRRLEDATIDDVAFAIQGMESESRLIHRRLGGLRAHLGAGALGVELEIDDAVALLERRVRDGRRARVVGDSAAGGGVIGLGRDDRDDDVRMLGLQHGEVLVRLVRGAPQPYAVRRACAT